MGEARPRFAEAAQVVVKALSQDVFEHHGEFFQIPRTSIRPRPISHPERRFYACSVSPESAEIMAKLGFGMLVIMQNEWAKCREDIDKLPGDRARRPASIRKPPIILTNVSCAESRDEAQERAGQYLGAQVAVDRRPLPFLRRPSRQRQRLRGLRQDGEDLRQAEGRRRTARRRPTSTSTIQIVGTPDDCLQQLGRAAAAHRARPPGHRVLLRQPAAPRGRDATCACSPSGCLPTLQNDPAFATPKRTAADTSAPRQAAGEGIFAPA